MTGSAAARHAFGLSTGRRWAGKRRRSLQRGCRHQHSTCQDRSNPTGQASRYGRATCSTDGLSAWLGLEISSHFLSIRLVREAQSGTMSLARRFSAIAPAATRNSIQKQSMQPDRPILARHWTQAEPPLPTQTAPQVTKAAAHLRMLQPAGSMPPANGLMPPRRRTGALCWGNFMSFSSLHLT